MYGSFCAAWLAYGFALLFAYGSFAGGGTAYGFEAAGAGEPDFFERLPKSDFFWLSRSPSFSLSFLLHGAMIAK